MTDRRVALPPPSFFRRRQVRHSHLPPLYNEKNLYGVAENIFPRLASFNLLCVHRDNTLVRTGMPKVSDFSAHPLKR